MTHKDTHRKLQTKNPNHDALLQELSRFVSFLVITLNMRNTVDVGHSFLDQFLPLAYYYFFSLVKSKNTSISLFLFVFEAAHNGV